MHARTHTNAHTSPPLGPRDHDYQGQFHMGEGRGKGVESRGGIWKVREMERRKEKNAGKERKR